MKKVFISQPMRGIKHNKIVKDRTEVIEHLHELGYSVIDSVFENEPEDGNPAVYYLGNSIKFLSLADAAYFMPGWDKARGCIIEHTVAENYGIDILKD